MPGRVPSAAVTALVAAAGLAAGAAPFALAGDPGEFAVESNPLGSAHGLTYRSATYESAPSGNTYAAAICPGAKVLTGGGGTVGPQAVNAWLIDSGPDWFTPDYVPPGTRKAWTTGVVNMGAPNSDVSSYAICHGAKALHLRTHEKGVTTQDQVFTARVSCPHGTHVTGGGFDSEGNIDQTLVSAPFDGGDADALPDDGWRVKIVAAQSDRNVFARAVCTGRLAPAYSAQTADLGLGDEQAAACPAGTSVSGGGAEIKGSVGQLRSSVPGDSAGDTDSVPDDRWTATADGGPGTTTWTVYAICLG